MYLTGKKLHYAKDGVWIVMRNGARRADSMFTLTNIREGDALQRNRGESFLLLNQDPGVRSRPTDQLDLAMATGHGLIGSLDGEVCAISLVYQFDPGAGGVFYEIGTMRVTAGGFGLQVFLACLHLMQIWLEDDSGPAGIFAVVAPGTGSEHNLRNVVGMRTWAPPPTLAMLRSSAGTAFAEGKPVLVADEGTIAAAFRALRGWHVGGGVFDTPKGGGQVTLELGWFDPALLELGP